MCGITGIFSRDFIPLETTIKKMMAQMPYRGPDDTGSWVNGQNIAFGHLRLSILDTSSAGRQPMFYADNNLVIVFNGEIYNFIELRIELKAKGYTFSTNTDTEVILASYKEWGTECLNRFNGMWAFAIWDQAQKILFLARDRMGIKPLYYYNVNGSFYFASEIKAILPAIQSSPDINHSLIDPYMSFGYIPGEDSLLKGIKRLLPGHSMLVKDGKIKITQYWDLKFEAGPDLGVDCYVNKGKKLLEDAIDIRLRSDVPLGIFLSGGLDSSTVVALLANRVPGQLKTFSVAYDFGKKYNETEYARLVSKQFNTEHHEIFITPQEFKNFIPNYIRHMDEPVAESAAISLYYISKLAKDFVTVVLSGEGSDEIFAGYDFYKYMLFLERYRFVVKDKIANHLKIMGERLMPEGSKLMKYLALGALPLAKRYKGISTYEEQVKQSLYRDDFKEMLMTDAHEKLDQFLKELFNHTADSDSLSQMLFFDTRTWLIDDLLIKADRMSMAASLELRVPFLDYRLVEFAASLPSKYKINKNNGKYLLKKMMKNILPESIIYRKKMGFPTPLKIMFQDELSDYSFDLLTGTSVLIHHYFKNNSIERILNDHVKKKKDNHRIIWQLVVLEMWLQLWAGKRN